MSNLCTESEYVLTEFSSSLNLVYTLYSYQNKTNMHTDNKANMIYIL